eukprot:gene5083-8683_t
MNLDTILTEEEKVTVIWLIDGFELSFLNKRKKEKRKEAVDEEEEEEKDIIQGTKMELPLWLALELAKRNFVEIEIPKFYGQKFLNGLIIGATEANLRENSPNYYKVGMLLSKQLEDDDINPALIKIYVKRFRQIVQNAQNNKMEQSLYSKNLTEFEENQFNEFRNSFQKFQEWKNKVGNSQISTSNALEEANRKKKKLK